MAQSDLIAGSLASAFGMLQQHLADFSEADALVRPAPNANHAIWQLGHLATLEVMVCGMYVPAKAPKLPADAQKTYGREGATIDDPTRLLKKDEALAILGQAHNALTEWTKTLSEADLAKPGPQEFKGWVSTVGELLIALPVHIAMHIGQIQVIRRKLGKKVLF